MENSDTTCSPAVEDVAAAIRRVRNGKCELTPGICTTCGATLPEKEIDLGEWNGKPWIQPVTSCPRSETLYEEADKLIKEQERNDQWREKCPPLYRKIDSLTRDDYPRIHWQRYDEAMQWNPSGDKSLLMVGESGAGKSTTLWHLLRKTNRVFRSWEVLGSNDLSRDFLASIQNGSTEALAQRLINVDVLALDDFGKDTASDGVLALLFDIINTRFEQLQPMIITTRFRGKDLEHRFSKDPTKAADIARRIRDYCEILTFRVQQGQTELEGVA